MFYTDSSHSSSPYAAAMATCKKTYLPIGDGNCFNP
ncbi:hypothetical protein FLAV_01361 [Flavobacteriales bacterium]|nr:hypothetical protein FLAV_01361 [Flavobacteriales bacterium]